jgi:hypothetical protein
LALDAANAGSGATVLIEAEAGIGETSLLGAACERPGAAEMTVLRACGSQLAGGYAPGVVRQCFEAELRRRGERVVRVALRRLSRPRGAVAPVALIVASRPAEDRAAAVVLDELRRETGTEHRAARDRGRWRPALRPDAGQAHRRRLGGPLMRSDMHPAGGLARDTDRHAANATAAMMVHTSPTLTRER